MNLFKQWRKESHGSRGGGGRELAKRSSETGGSLARFRDEMDRVFDRVWRDFDRGGESWLAPFSSMPSLFEGFGGGWPALDMAEDDKAVTLRVDVPGLDARDVDVEVSGNLLTFRGQRHDEWSDKKGGVYRRERRAGSFARTVTLPDYVDADKVEARYEKGTLTLTIPKIPGKGPRKVQVSA